MGRAGLADRQELLQGRRKKSPKHGRLPHKRKADFMLWLLVGMMHRSCFTPDLGDGKQPLRRFMVAAILLRAAGTAGRGGSPCLGQQQLFVHSPGGTARR